MTYKRDPRPRTGSTSPGSRTDEIHAALLLYVAHPRHLDERADAGWLADHPSGFGAISTPSKGISYGVNLTVLEGRPSCRSRRPPPRTTSRCSTGARRRSPRGWARATG
jgi:hypothetical protein